MTRFETTIVAALVLILGVVQAPASGQIIIQGEADGVKSKRVIIEGRHPSGRASRTAEPAKPEVPTFVVSGGLEATKEKGKESAIRAAVEKLHDHLMQQDPPILRYPTVEIVRTMVIPHPDASRADAEFGKITEEILDIAGKKETRYQVEIAIKVKPEHVRELRARERSSDALWVLAGLAALAGVVAIFFRIDAWTRGYLTSWLVLGTIGAVTMLIGLWWWAR